MESSKERRPSGWFFAEWISIIGTFMVCFVFLFYQNQIQCARSDALYLQFENALQSQTQRSDSLYEQFQQANQSQTARSDKLYEMFIELVKERKT